ncbi:MAG: YqeG family HAD IIIA-type phosphatase [Clostridia bacterium]|nr:YqeG family HAD IIIA-type phosphatase [Clostridia bacterium]
MALLRPTAALEKVTDITPELLRQLEIDAILLDVDNTLAPPTEKIPYEGVQAWIDEIKSAGFAVVICSNNYHSRIRPFSDSVGLECVAMSLKPFPFGFNRAKRKLKEKPKSVLVVGDQIYTDVLGANLAGMKSILLCPQSEEHGFTIYVRRRLEIGVRKKLKILKRGEDYVGS